MWWSWILGFVGLIGFWLAGRKVWWAWYVNIANQVLWTIYSLVTEQYGFLVATVFYFWVFTNNAIKWTKEHRESTRCGAEPPWRLVDAGTCVAPKGHEGADPDHDWHADGNGYIWTDTAWRWMGPVVDLSEEMANHPARELHGLEEIE